jgi:hypothetical protein
MYQGVKARENKAKASDPRKIVNMQPKHRLIFEGYWTLEAKNSLVSSPIKTRLSI